MNKHILMAIDYELYPNKYTQEQLQDNAYDAFYIASAMINALNACCMDNTDNKTTLINESINEYLRLTGENRKDYVNAIIESDRQ